MKQKLLVLTSTFPRWTQDSDPPFVYELSKRLTKDFDITVHAPHYPGSKTYEEIDEIKVHRFRYCIKPLEKLAGSTGILPTLKQNKLFYCLVPFFVIAQFFSLVILVRKKRPDIIHAHWILPQGFIAVIMKVLFGVPVVVTAHGGDIFGLQHGFFKMVKRFVIKRVDSITVVSRALKKIIKSEIYDTTVEVVPMGVCSKKFSFEGNKEVLKEKYGHLKRFILYVGRLSEKKGVIYLVEAMPIILNEFPDAKLLIVGAGELRSALQSRVKEKGLQDSIFFEGGVPNHELPMYYSSCDIFVGPSIEAKDGDTEGFGLTFVEAAMSGCILIGSNVGGIGDIIEDSYTGFLVPEKDSNALAEKIIYTIRNLDDLEPMSLKAREKCIEYFDIEVVSKKYADILLDVITT